MIELFDDNFGLTTTQILRNLATQLDVDYDGGEIRVSRDGNEYLIFIYLPERRGLQETSVGASSFFEIKTKIQFSHPSFGIRKSDSIDWIAEHILAKTDFQVGDADFDARFHIRVDESNWGREFFSNSNVMLGITDLLTQGFDVLRSEDGYLKAVKYLKISGLYPTTDAINNAIKQLNQIISNFPNNLVSGATQSQIDKEEVSDRVVNLPEPSIVVNSAESRNKRENDKVIIDNETAQGLGCLFFLVIWCPIIWVVLLAYNIPIPSPRFIFWGVAVLTIILFFASMLIDMFFQIALYGSILDRYLYLRRKYFPIYANSGDFTELIKKNGRSGALLGFIFLVCCFIGFVWFLYFITFSK